ncbi:MAG: hypothetical protein WAO58_05835 [Fimbriimonadaceae bacterium]
MTRYRFWICSLALAGLLLGCAPGERKPDDAADPTRPSRPASKEGNKGIDPDGTGPGGDMEDGARPGINPTTG